MIRLKDGSLLHGKVIAFVNGVYQIETKTLGVVAVKESNILSISNMVVTSMPFSAQSVPSGQLPKGSSADALKEKYTKAIMSDAAILESLRRLSQDEEMIAIFSDKELQGAIHNQDIPSLTANPDFLKFMHHPVVRDIAEKMMRSSGGDSPFQIQEPSSKEQ